MITLIIIDYYRSALELLDRALCKLSFIIIITITVIIIIIIIIINSPVSVLTNLRQDHLQHREMFS